ncbi:MAG: anthrone oxygenase family protein [Thermodesulfobacteriota bacterium]
MDNLIYILVLLSAVGSGVMAGVFFIFSNTVMNALGQLPPAQGISSMVSINRVILNPLFFVAFIGTAIVSALVLISLIWFWGHSGSTYALLGSLIYIVGSFIVTIAFNVPRNEALDKVDPETEQAKLLWDRYLKEWTMWNHVRTVACVLSLVSFLFAFRYW